MKPWLPLLLLWPLLAGAAPDIVVLGLFKDRAVLSIDGQRRVLARGETSPEGVKLLSADSESAVLAIEGQTRRYTLGSHIGASYTPPEESVVRIWPSGGLYRTSGFINGRTVDFLVDTGASSVAMGAAVARRLGIDYRYRGEPHVVETANGRVRAYRVRLDTVRVGDIQLRNVEASVLEGNGAGNEVLLGMTYLGRVEMQREGEAMVLRQKH
jgi:aspartyl protease family protein